MTTSNTHPVVDKSYFTDLFNDIASAWNQGDREPYIINHVHCVYMVPHGETLNDPDAIRQYVEEFPDVNLQFEIVDAWGGDGRAGVHGKYRIYNPDESLMDKGKFLGAYEENAIEKWKLTHAIWNSDLPIPE